MSENKKSKNEITTDTVKSVYKLLNDSKLTKMEDKDKFIVIKAVRKFKPIAADFEDLKKDVQEKLKGENFEEMQKKALQWNEEGGKTTLTEDERKEVNMFFYEFNKNVEECLKEERERKHELEYEKLSEDAFGKFISSNDFKVDDIITIQEVMVQ
jgi:hypothetical protein